MHASDQCLALGGILAPLVPADKDMLTLERQLWRNRQLSGDSGSDWIVRVETRKEWERREFGGRKRAALIVYRERTECPDRVTAEWSGEMSIDDVCRETGKTRAELVEAIKAAEQSERGTPIMVPVIRLVVA